jgi:hypothetical protein
MFRLSVHLSFFPLLFSFQPFLIITWDTKERTRQGDRDDSGGNKDRKKKYKRDYFSFFFFFLF